MLEKNNKIFIKVKLLKIFQISHTKLKGQEYMEGSSSCFKRNNFQPRLVHRAKLSFKFGGEIRMFHKKEHLKKFMTTNQHYTKYSKIS